VQFNNFRIVHAYRAVKCAHIYFCLLSVSPTILPDVSCISGPMTQSEMSGLVRVEAEAAESVGPGWQFKLPSSASWTDSAAVITP